MRVKVTGPEKEAKDISGNRLVEEMTQSLSM